MNMLLPAIIFAFSTSFTPGPNNFMLMHSGLNFGVKRSIPHCLGVNLGFTGMFIIVALGFGTLFHHYPMINTILKFVGAAYMLYLAWKILQSHAKTSCSTKSARPWTFMQAVMFQWVNPKAWLMSIGAISLFTLSTNYLYNAFALALIFFLIGFFSEGFWVSSGALMSKVLKNDRQRFWFNAAMALTLALSVILIFLE